MPLTWVNKFGLFVMRIGMRLANVHYIDMQRRFWGAGYSGHYSTGMRK